MVRTPDGEGTVLEANVVAGTLKVRSKMCIRDSAQGAGLLGAVQNCDLLCGLGQNLQQSRRNPRTIQTLSLIHISI